MELLTESSSVEVPATSATPRRRKWPFVVAVLVVGLAGVGATAFVLTRGDDAPRQGRNGALAAPQPDLHFLLDAAPTAWVAHGAGDFVPAEFSYSWNLWGDYQTAMYGTTDDPTAPVMILGVGDQLNDGGFAGIGIPLVDQTQATSDRASVLCGSATDRVNRCFVSVEGTQVQVHSFGFTHDELTAALLTTRVRDGMPEVDPAALPAGTAHLGSWRNAMPSAVGENGDAIISSIRYKGPENALAILQVGRADEHDIAAAFDLGVVEPTAVDGVTYYRGAGQGAQIEWVIWQRDGFAFQLMATPDKGVDLLDLARSARPATADEWATAVAAQAPWFPPSAVTTDPQAAPPQYATAPTAVKDVPVTAVAVDRPERGGITVASMLPDGMNVPVTLIHQDTTTSVGVEGVFSTFGDPEESAATVNALYGTTAWVAYVETTDPHAASLRVTRANGDRYVAALVPHPTRDGVWVAAVGVPIDEFVGADVVDEFGNRMDALGFPAD